jgi:ABC-type multidrug transport system fused ATPase/permease subunit
VLDEATSALDSITESRVMKSICNLSDKLSILIIAHRLSTVRDCDRIIFLDSGKLVDCGTFEYLIQTNSQFRKMSSLSNYA